MARKIGLTESFTLDVEKPVELPDYLDEMEAAQVPRPKLPERVSRGEARGVGGKSTPPANHATVSPQPPPASQGEIHPKPEKPRKHYHRRHFNITPETDRHFDEIVSIVQRLSGQEDAKPAEILDALVGALHGARDQLDLSQVPRRGQWGKPTAAAFRVALSRAFASAIAENQKTEGEMSRLLE